MDVVGDAAHWDDRYRSTRVGGVSWYEEYPATSLDLLDAAGVTRADSVLDVGGGASRLVDRLLARGHGDLAVLDLSRVALETACVRLGDPEAVRWIAGDVTTWEPPRRWSVWHDRALLHFLVVDDDRAAYVRNLRRGLAPGGVIVVGAFAEDGPTECSALPVRRHAPDDLVRFVRELDLDVEVVEQRRRLHRTPRGAVQPFNWIVGRAGPRRS